MTPRSSRARREHLLALVLLGLGATACGGPPPAATGDESTNDTTNEGAGGEAVATAPHEDPPASEPPRDVHLPPIARETLANGLELNTVRAGAFPLVYVRLVVRGGLAADPAGHAGLSSLVANMLREGTRSRTSAEIAEEIEYTGADLQVGADAQQIMLQLRGTSDQLATMMGLLADLALNPTFDATELERLQRREIDRLTISYGDASIVARREFYRAIYGEGHPLANVDSTPDGIEACTRRDLVDWHRRYFVPGNAYLVVAGDVTPEAAAEAARDAFGSWRRRAVPTLEIPAAPTRTSREVIVVNRPGSAQSVINIGNIAIERAHPDWVRLEVANEILGGSASSRLFMDLRERRSLTYGAYSGIDELAHAGPFRARGGIGRDPAQPDVDRTPVAMEAFMEHLDRVVTEPPTEEEIALSTRYLSDSFPLSIDTIGRVGWMVSYLRLFGLPDDYWDGYRSEIRAVTAADALAAARAHIDPEHALVVIVGDAASIAEPMRRWGPVRVIDIDDGHTIATFPALSGPSDGPPSSTSPTGD